MNGKLDGKQIFYYESQDTQIVQTHREGIFDGPYRSFYPAGGLKVEGIYFQNKMEGLW